MTKSTIIILVCIILLGLTGYHKKEDTNKLVYVSFNPDISDQTDIIQLGEVLYVFVNGNEYAKPRYLGTLTNRCTRENINKFTGNIRPWKKGEKLSFFYFGDDHHIACFQTIAQDDAITRSFDGRLKNMISLPVFDISKFNGVAE